MTYQNNSKGVRNIPLKNKQGLMLFVKKNIRKTPATSFKCFKNAPVVQRRFLCPASA
jgi:hypothetical protein